MESSFDSLESKTFTFGAMEDSLINRESACTAALRKIVVLGLLGPRQMGRVACTSRLGNTLSEDQDVWRSLCLRDFGILYRADRCREE